MNEKRPIAVVLEFINSIQNKNHEKFSNSLHPMMQDALPNGTIVKSAKQLISLHTGFMQSKLTGFRPFDWRRPFEEGAEGQSEDREFVKDDLEILLESEQIGFYRISAEVDRPHDFRDINSPVGRYYMHLGILVKDGRIVHIQNTPFNPKMRDPR